MLRRSDFMAATYALSLVFANFGIAIAARMPMMTTTIRSSMRGKPFLLLICEVPDVRGTETDRQYERWRTLYRRFSEVPDGDSRHVSLAFSCDFFEHVV